MSTNRLIFSDAYSLMRKLQVMVKVFMLITTFSFFTKKRGKHKPFERKLLFFHFKTNSKLKERNRLKLCCERAGESAKEKLEN